MQYLTQTLGSFLEEMARKESEREFIVYPDRNLRYTYQSFNDRVNLLAAGLLSIGLQKGDHLGIWATNVPDWLTFMFATAKIGVVLVTVNTLYKKHELSYILEQSDMKALVIIDGFRDTDYVNTVYDIVPELRKCERGYLKSEKFPHLQSVIFLGPQKHRGMYNITELLLLGSHYSAEKVKEAGNNLNCHEVINMQYTSGTTGFPKGVMLSHYNILNNGFYIGERQKLSSKDRLCLPVPLFHCFGCVLGVLAVLTHGGTLVILESFDPLLALAAVEKEKCTAIYGVPTMFIAELNHPMFSLFDLSSLRTGIMAGSPCPIEIMKRVIEQMHCSEITIAYGLTEASPVITQTATDDPIERRVSTVGKPLPGIEVKVIDPHTGKRCAPAQPGELCCRGYNVMKGYYNMPEQTKEVIDEDGWLHSRDLASYDKENYYRITGRIKDMIIRGGENIYPLEIEQFLYTMPEVQDVQVVGIPDEKYGEQVGTFIILREGASISEEDVKDFCRGKIARYKTPYYVFFVNEYPATASGKIQKYKLREKAREILKIDKDIF